MRLSLNQHPQWKPENFVTSNNERHVAYYLQNVSVKHKPTTSNVKMNAAGFRNTSAHLYQTTRRHAIDDISTVTAVITSI